MTCGVIDKDYVEGLVCNAPALKVDMTRPSARSRGKKGHDDTLSSLNAVIDALNLLEDIAGAEQFRDALGSVTILLTTIRVCFV